MQTQKFSDAITCNHGLMQILKTFRNTSTVISVTYARMCIHMQLTQTCAKSCKRLKTSLLPSPDLCTCAQTYATYANICKLMQNPEILKNHIYSLPRDLCTCAQTYATYANICTLLKTYTILSTAFPKTYARVRRHMQLMQTPENV